jgi:mannose-6-phosphate isomerase-like protein (cupin superfamily)
VESADLRDFVEFEEGQVVRRTVFESEHLWTQLLCLDRGRHYGPVSDPGSDAVMTVVAGEAAFQVDRGRKRLKQWGAILVPAGSQVTVTNASPEPLVVLVAAAPPPVPRPVSG